MDRLAQLKKIVQKVSEAASIEEQIDLLTQGFELFSLETRYLNESFSTLRGQFQTVNTQLEETNLRLANKVQELHVLSTYLDNLLSNISQGLLFIDCSSHITTYNKAAETILQIPREKILFQPYFDFFPDHHFGFSMKEALSEKKPPKSAYPTITCQDGSQKDLEIDNAFIPPKGSSEQGFDFTEGLILLIRDVTEIRRLQLKASQVDRMKELGEMAAQVAHEIRNPLGGIKGFASLLQRDLANNPELQNLANYIVEGTDTLDRLVTKVLNFSRPLQLQLESVELIHLLDDLKKALQADKKTQSDIVFNIKSSFSHFYLSADPGLLKGALLNLIINAIQAMPNGGTITIEILEKNNAPFLKIQDTGCGIAKENLKKIYNPFFTTKTSGNGLGLSEVLKVVHAHGAELEVESTIGQGTIFTIKFPVKL